MAPKSTTAGAEPAEDATREAPQSRVSGAAANVVVLVEDPTLLELLKHSLEGRQRIWRADNVLHASDLLVAAQTGVLFIDAALLMRETAALLDRLNEQFPDLPIVVAGRRDDELELADRISRGVVFRFLHKPVSAERVRTFIDAAVRRSVDKPAPSARSALNPVAAARSLRLPRFRIEPGTIRRALRIGLALLLLVAVLWSITSLVASRPWERIAWPSPPAPATPEATPQAAPKAAAPAVRQEDAELARVLSAAGIALSQGRLAEPDGQNAIELYRSVLSHDPDNAAARAGLTRVADELLLQADEALQAGDLAAAAGAVDAARSADPSHARVAAYTTQLTGARERLQSPAATAAAIGAASDRAFRERVDRLLTLADAQMRQGRLVGGVSSAEAQVLEARMLAPDDPGVQQAVNALSGRMLLAATTALGAGDAQAARGWLDRAGALGVDADQVARLRAEMESVRLASVQEDHSRLLALANQRIAQGRLLEPAADSARRYIDLLRAADPSYEGLGETEALLSARLLDEARRLTGEDRPAEAARFLAAAESAGARAADLSALRKELAAVQARQAASQEILPEGALTRIVDKPTRYPPHAAARGIEGWVDVHFTIAANGATRDITVIAAEPRGVFDGAVRDAIAAWRYQPRVVAGKPVSQRVMLRVRFELERD